MVDSGYYDHLIAMKRETVLPQIVQVFQVILFYIPVITLLMMGLVILIKPVSVINRRLFMVVFVPLLLANIMAVMAESFSSGSPVDKNWQFWLTLAVDISLSVTVLFTFRGFLVYGMCAAQVETALTQAFRMEGGVVTSQVVKKRTLLGGEQDVCVLDIHKADQHESLLIIDKVNEVLVQRISRAAMADLSKALPDEECQDDAHQVKSHRIGVLYLVLAFVFAVSVWIFFFEPRLVLIE